LSYKAALLECRIRWLRNTYDRQKHRKSHQTV
jgi:hypothetical protein